MGIRLEDEVVEHITTPGGTVIEYTEWRAKEFWSLYQTTSINIVATYYKEHPDIVYALIMEYKRRRKADKESNR